MRDFGADDALALMRAQNEPPETVVRLVRGELDGEPTDVPGAFRVDARRRAGARRGTHLAAEPRLAARGARRRLRATASASSTPAPRPGGKATMLRGEVVAVEINEARARELEENVAAARRRRTCASSTPTRRRCRRSSTASTARWSTRPAPVSACSASRPDLRWRAKPLPELQLRAAARRRRARQAGRDDRLQRVHAQRRGERGTSSTRPGSRSTRHSATSGRSSGIRVARSSC